ncbi:hypothetical protein ACTJK6_08590 [Ralstonia sp. 22086]|uniref:hypothetical protein n=1 Tax=Ralstonia sp. 22086 TaxID=3453870 RepID=UPI000FD16E60|nr:hypothetical protein CFM90_16185 [Ralstonia solanacearum]
MRPLFTIHAGEYIVGDYIEQRFPDLRVWIPSKDDGVDLLVTDKTHRKTVSLQIKFSKDHLATGRNRNATAAIKSGGWWTFDPKKIAQSTADYWVLVLCEFTSRSYDFVIIEPKELARRYKRIAPNKKTIQSYFWVTRQKECWETRSLSKEELAQVCDGSYKDNARQFTSFLNRWQPLVDALRGI